MMSAMELEEVKASWPRLARVVSVPHSETEYRQLVGFLDALTDEVGEDESHPLASLMDLISVLIERYEEETVPELRN